MIKISTTILTAKDRIASIKKLNNTQTDYIHFDVMDNKFVPNFQMPIDEVNELGTYSQKEIEIHLMVEDPESFIRQLRIKNVKTIIFHVEISRDINSIIEYIKSLNYKVGLAINPNTDLNTLDKYIDHIDQVIVMSAQAGFGGQKFQDSTIERIKTVREKRKDIIIEVDCGINDETIKKIKDIADIAAVGSYITNKEDYNEAINNLKN